MCGADNELCDFGVPRAETHKTRRKGKLCPVSFPQGTEHSVSLQCARLHAMYVQVSRWHLERRARGTYKAAKTKSSCQEAATACERTTSLPDPIVRGASIDPRGIHPPSKSQGRHRTGAGVLEIAGAPPAAEPQGYADAVE